MEYAPQRMRPCYKEYLWGGGRLKRDFNKTDAPEVTAESWELACHPEGASVVAEGSLAGLTLAQLGELDRAGFWGRACPEGDFPILVKLIDAKQALSVQLHPSNKNARPDERGKAEMWYIVECEPQSFVYFGFSQRITREEVLRRAGDGTICRALNRVPVARGDVFYILPGTIHAVGAGILIAEIQQNSNTTFRVYDYQRKDLDGDPRPLHLDRAVETLSYEPVIPEESKANSCVTFPGFSMAEMFSCGYFRAYRVDVRTAADLRCDGQSFQHLLCVDGNGTIFANGKYYRLRRGDSYFLPAALGDYRIGGACRVLLTRI